MKKRTTLAELKSILNNVQKNNNSPKPKKEDKVKALVDIGCVVNDSKLPIIVVEVKGHVRSFREFQDRVVNYALSRPKVARHAHARKKFKLVLDLRKVFFVDHFTASQTLTYYGSWLSESFERICIITPKSHRNRDTLYHAYMGYVNSPDDWSNVPLPPCRIVERARDVKEWIEPKEVPTDYEYSWPCYSPVGI